LGGEDDKLDADRLRTSALLGTPSVLSVHDYYPFALEDGGRLAPMAVELVDRLAILAAFRRFLGISAIDSRSLGSYIMSVCNFSFVELLRFVFAFFGGLCGENSCNVFMLLFIVLWVPISATLCRRAVLVLGRGTKRILQSLKTVNRSKVLLKYY
jgi:hypothetical protein